MSFNKITIIGNLGKDPELSYTQSGVAVAKFSVGVNPRSNNEAMQTQWYRVTAWRQAAENCSKYLRKGQKVYVDGTLTVDEWKDRDNVTRFSLEINADNVQFLTDRNELVADRESVDENSTEAKPKDSNDIPF